MTRRCSHCGHNGHNSRTCPDRGVRLFGVRLTENAMRKSVSTGNLNSYPNGNQGSTPDNSEGAAPPDGYVSDGLVQTSTNARERKKGVPWTEEEHRMFLLGLQKLGKGDWRGISRNYVQTRTPTQVASHAQKYFIRQSNLNKRKRRSSLFDIVSDSMPMGQSGVMGGAGVVTVMEENHHHRLPNGSRSSPPPPPVPPLHHLAHSPGSYPPHPSFFDPVRQHSFPVAMPAFSLPPQLLHHMLAAAAATMPPQPSGSGVGEMSQRCANSTTNGMRENGGNDKAPNHIGSGSCGSPPSSSGCDHLSMVCVSSDGSCEDQQKQQQGDEHREDGGRVRSPGMGVAPMVCSGGGGEAGAPLGSLGSSRMQHCGAATHQPPMAFHHFPVLPWPGLSPLGYGLQHHQPHHHSASSHHTQLSQHGCAPSGSASSNSKICRPTACIPTSPVPIPEPLGLSMPSQPDARLGLSPPSAEASSSLTSLRLLDHPSSRHSAFHAKASFSSASLTNSSQSAISVV